MGGTPTRTSYNMSHIIVCDVRCECVTLMVLSYYHCIFIGLFAVIVLEMRMERAEKTGPTAVGNIDKIRLAMGFTLSL